MGEKIDINRFTGGMNQDFNPISQPDQSVRYMLNFVPLSKDGNIASAINENGTVLLDNVIFPAGFNVIGYTILYDEIIVVLAHEAGYSQVGIIKQNGVGDGYVPIAPYDSALDTVPENNSELGFDLNYPVDCIARKLINGSRRLYFTDNYNPFGFIDLDNPPKVGNVKDSIGLVATQSFPLISISEIKENSASTIRPGIVQFITRYVTDGGGYTDFGIPCDPIPMVIPNKGVGVNNYHGNFYEEGIVPKNIILKLENVDIKYKELEIISIYYQGSQSVFGATICGRIPITSESLVFTYTGPNTEESINLTREQLRKLPITYNRAKCIEQKNNTLFLSNLSSRSSFDSDLQKVANNIKVSYQIEEHIFNGRGDNYISENTGFTMLGNPYRIPLSTSSGKFAYGIGINMNKNVDPTTGNDVNNYTVKTLGNNAIAKITITEDLAHKIQAGDTIKITSYDSTEYTFTFITGIPVVGSYDVQIGTTQTETVFNLLDSIKYKSIKYGKSEVPFYAIRGSHTVIGDTKTTDIIFAWADRNILANDSYITSTSIDSTITNGDFYGANTAVSTMALSSVVVDENTISLGIPEYRFIIQDIDSISITSPISDETLVESYYTGASYKIIRASSYNSSSAESDFTDYINENIDFEKKSYRRGEVYSLGFFLLFKDGTTSYTYHIPGNKEYGLQLGKNESTEWDDYFSTISPISSKTVGTYVSDQQYPQGQNYPGNLDGDDKDSKGVTGLFRNIRHHYMPELINEPHFYQREGVTYIRMLGLNFNLVTDFPEAIKNDIAEVVFVRERRTENNKSIVAQGCINRCVISADKFTNNGEVDGELLTNGYKGEDILDGYFATEMPFFNNLEKIEYTGDFFSVSGAHTNSGIAYPGFDTEYHEQHPPEEGATYANGWKHATDILNNRGFFHSPETNLLTGFKPDSATLLEQTIKPVMKLTGNFKRINFDHDIWRRESTPTKGIDYLKYYMYADYYQDYNSFSIETLPSDALTINKARYAQANKLRIAALEDSNLGLKTCTRWTQGGLELALDNNLPEQGGSKFKIVNDADLLMAGGLGPSGYSHSGSIEFINGGDAVSGTLNNYLYNIVKNISNQYGNIGGKEYIPISRNLYSEQTTFNSIFGGDTFITKYSVNTGNLINYFPFDRKGGAATNRPFLCSSHEERGYGNIDRITIGGEGEGNTPGKACGWDFRSCFYFFVESEINTYYRHKPITPTEYPTGGDPITDEKQDYFPNTLDLGTMLMNFFPYLGEINAYNTQYSYENNVRTFFTKDSTTQVINKFENRTIWSEKASNDDTLDSYRSILQSNYYDLPANTGPIWDTFVAYDTLFMHTPKSLWATYAEQAATLQGGNVSDIVLGTGNLFARPSQEVMTTKGGYGGTISQFGGSHTEIGYVFPDILQGKIFLLALDKSPYLKDLSLGMSTFFQNTLPEDIIKFGNEFNYSGILNYGESNMDNPFIGKGICTGFDYRLHRIWITKHNSFTISYSTILDKWYSFHTYQPQVYISFDNRSLFQKDGSLYEMNIGEKGLYMDDIERKDSVLEIVCSKEMDNKVFENIIINSSSDDGKIRIKNDNFAKLQVYTDRANSGVYNLTFPTKYLQFPENGEKFIKYKNEEYRIAVPRDAILDTGFEIDDINNIQQDQAPDKLIKAPRIKGQYAHFRFTYDNSLNYNFVLKLISIIFSANIR